MFLSEHRQLRSVKRKLSKKQLLLEQIQHHDNGHKRHPQHQRPVSPNMQITQPEDSQLTPTPLQDPGTSTSGAALSYTEQLYVEALGNGFITAALQSKILTLMPHLLQAVTDYRTITELVQEYFFQVQNKCGQ